MNKSAIVAGVLAGVLVLVGCGPEPKAPTDTGIAKPAVNDTNCLNDNLARMDPRVRQSFADDCARSGSFKPNSGRTW